VPWANGVLVPVNIRWGPGEITYALADADTSILIVDDAFAPMVPGLVDGYGGLRVAVHAGEGPAPDGMLSYEELVEGPRRSPMPGAAATPSPGSSTRAAPPASPRG
jgi:hypothetical protein